MDHTMTNNGDSQLLSVEEVSRKFGGVQALMDVTFSVTQGSIISMIGPNGAGKSTFINVATGIYAPDTGRISFQGRDITGLSAHAIAYLGIGRPKRYREDY